MRTSTRSPRIYVACLAAYNSGILHGAWIDADQDADDIYEDVQKMLNASPEPDAEEWAIHDHEDFHPWSPSEYTSFKDIATAAELIADHADAGAAFINNDDSVLDSDTLSDDFHESYQGAYESERDYAYACAEDPGLPDGTFLGTGDNALEPYLDWDALEEYYLGDCWTYKDSSYQVHVFRSS
jgi:antirestriction protein